MGGIITLTRTKTDTNSKLDNNHTKISTKSFLDLDIILNSKETLSVFTEHMTSEYNVENLHCWDEINKLNANHEGGDISYIELNNKIIDRFLNEKSLEEVNIPITMKRIFFNELEQIRTRENDPNKQCIPLTLLDNIHSEVYGLIYRDSFPRFKSSARWDICLNILEDLWESSGENIGEVDDTFIGYLCKDMKTSLHTTDRTWRLQKFNNVFTGIEFVEWIIRQGYVQNEREAILCGNKLIKMDIISHVSSEHNMENRFLFYRMNNQVIERMDPTKNISCFSFFHFELLLTVPRIYQYILSLAPNERAKSILKFWNIVDDLKRKFKVGIPKDIAESMYNRFFVYEGIEKLDIPKLNAVKLLNDIHLNDDMVDIGVFDQIVSRLCEDYERSHFQDCYRPEHWDHILSIAEETLTQSVISNNPLLIEQLDVVAGRMKLEIEEKDRMYHLKNYKKVLLGTDLYKWLLNSCYTSNEREVMILGNLLILHNVFEHVVREHMFENEYLFYRYCQPSEEEEKHH